VHARCLKELGRRLDSIHVLLEIIARAVAAEKTTAQRRLDARLRDPIIGLEDDFVFTEGYLSDLEIYARDMLDEFTVPLEKYFGDLHVEPFTRHYADQDGFRLRLRVTHLLPDDLPIDKVRVRLVPAMNGQGQDIWLESDRLPLLKRGVTVIWVGTHVSCHLDLRC
jgi:hypothetical protein